jgi:hypothetical protein
MKPLLVALALLGASARGSAKDRLPRIPPGALTEAQKEAIAKFKAARSVDISGPFVPLLRSPSSPATTRCSRWS